MKTIQEKLKDLPELPGVYLMKDSHGGIIYVGKAKNLKNRVRSYFHHNLQHSKKVQRLVWNIADLEWQVVDTELDAFLLECQLIQENQPIYNRMMKTHSNYKYVLVADDGLKVVADDGAAMGALFGPFRQYKQLPELLSLLQETYLLPGNSQWLTLAITKQLPEMPKRPLTERMGEINGFFSGGETDFFQLLDRRIAASAQSLQFEKAAELQEQKAKFQHFHQYIQERKAFCRQERLVYAQPLADGVHKKVYQISGGRVLATKTVKLGETVVFDWPEPEEAAHLRKEDVDPVDILRGHIKGHGDETVLGICDKDQP